MDNTHNLQKRLASLCRKKQHQIDTLARLTLEYADRIQSLDQEIAAVEAVLAARTDDD